MMFSIDSVVLLDRGGMLCSWSLKSEVLLDKWMTAESVPESLREVVVAASILVNSVRFADGVLFLSVLRVAVLEFEEKADEE